MSTSNGSGETKYSRSCAACKHQRRKCDPASCQLGPYFQTESQEECQAIIKVFGVSNMTKMLKSVETAEDKYKAVESIKWEASVWKEDPTNGPLGKYRKLERENRELKDLLKKIIHANQQGIPFATELGIMDFMQSDSNEGNGVTIAPDELNSVTNGFPKENLGLNSQPESYPKGANCTTVPHGTIIQGQGNQAPHGTVIFQGQGNYVNQGADTDIQNKVIEGNPVYPGTVKVQGRENLKQGRGHSMQNNRVEAGNQMPYGTIVHGQASLSQGGRVAEQSNVVLNQQQMNNLNDRRYVLNPAPCFRPVLQGPGSGQPTLPNGHGSNIGPLYHRGHAADIPPHCQRGRFNGTGHVFNDNASSQVRDGRLAPYHQPLAQTHQNCQKNYDVPVPSQFWYA